MPALARNLSSISVLSSTTTASTDSAGSDTTADIQTRKRPTPTQLDALQTMFDEKPYLTRGERMGLAESIDMDLKAVTAWFQNRRQAAKRVTTTTVIRNKAANVSSSSHAPLSLRATASLDAIASLAEKRSKRSRTRHRSDIASPISEAESTIASSVLASPYSSTSNASEIRMSGTRTPEPQDNHELWRLLKSSPPSVLTSPDTEKARFLALPNQARSLRSLEFACANARTRRRREPSTEEHGSGYGRSESLPLSSPKGPKRKLARIGEKENTPELENSTAAKDVEAAMLLMAFKVRT